MLFNFLPILKIPVGLAAGKFICSINPFFCFKATPLLCDMLLFLVQMDELRKDDPVMKLVLVGASGYGSHYLTLLTEYVDKDSAQLCAVIDPFVKNAPSYEWLCENKIPMYDTLDEFYQNDSAELVIISSPISFHEEQIITALNHHSNVLCEKPLVATLQEAAEIKSAWQKSGLKLGVGFQWSFSKSILALKKDILDGVFGKPICLKTHISWKRGDVYYDKKGWKGSLRDKKGKWVLDSVATNATAHYLHNLFFITGKAMNESNMPVSIEGSVYRGRDIGSFDTCFLRGQFEDGSTFVYSATHMGEVNSNPQFSYEFEKGTIVFDENTSDTIIAHMNDGTEKRYGTPQSFEENAQKIICMIDCINHGGEPFCGVDTIMPHLTVCNAVFDNMKIKDFPQALICRETNPAGQFVKGVYEASVASYEQGKLPDELGYDWAAPSVKVDLSTVKKFTGRYFL